MDFSIPDTMTVIEVTKPGGPEVLTPAQRAIPQVAEDEVLIEIAASGVNGADIPQREGRSAQRRGSQFVLGLEVSGTVRRIGNRVRRWRVGDRVCALVDGGGYAEYCVAPEGQCMPVPQGLGLIEAAGLPETNMTVWANVFEHGSLKPGERLLVHGGASGVGTTTIQIANHYGARVVATAGSDEKCTICQKLGAKRAVNYKHAALSDALLEASSGEGYDVILDMVGAPNFATNLKLLRRSGRHVVIATKGGHETSIDLKLLQEKHLVVTGSRLGPRSRSEKDRLARQVEQRVWPLYESKAIRPVIDSIFHLHEARLAHERLQSGGHVGKIILCANSTPSERIALSADTSLPHHGTDDAV